MSYEKKEPIDLVGMNHCIEGENQWVGLGLMTVQVIMAHVCTPRLGVKSTEEIRDQEVGKSASRPSPSSIPRIIQNPGINAVINPGRYGIWSWILGHALRREMLGQLLVQRKLGIKERRPRQKKGTHESDSIT